MRAHGGCDSGRAGVFVLRRRCGRSLRTAPLRMRRPSGMSTPEHLVSAVNFTIRTPTIVTGSACVTPSAAPSSTTDLPSGVGSATDESTHMRTNALAAMPVVPGWNARGLAVADGDRAGLVQEQRVDVAGGLDGFARLGDDVGPQGAVHAGDADGRQQSADGGRDQADEQRDEGRDGDIGPHIVVRRASASAQTMTKTSVNPASRIVSAISFGVFWRDEPSTSAIILSRKLSPGRAVTFTSMRSERTFVPPVTELLSPPASRITGADSPVMALSSIEARPSTISPSAAIGVARDALEEVALLEVGAADDVRLAVRLDAFGGRLAGFAQRCRPAPCRGLRRWPRRSWRRAPLAEKYGEDRRGCTAANPATRRPSRRSGRSAAPAWRR